MSFLRGVKFPNHSISYFDNCFQSLKHSYLRLTYCQQHNFFISFLTSLNWFLSFFTNLIYHITFVRGTMGFYQLKPISSVVIMLLVVSAVSQTRSAVPIIWVPSIVLSHNFEIWWWHSTPLNCDLSGVHPYSALLLRKAFDFFSKTRWVGRHCNFRCRFPIISITWDL